MLSGRNRNGKSNRDCPKLAESITKAIKHMLSGRNRNGKSNRYCPKLAKSITKAINHKISREHCKRKSNRDCPKQAKSSTNSKIQGLREGIKREKVDDIAPNWQNRLQIQKSKGSERESKEKK